jgi:KDO2-lipid IV(A) lauroyltransferase
VTSRERRLEAPHRRGPTTPRIVERIGVVAYRATAWVLHVLPVRFSRSALGVITRVSYLGWPGRRRWSNANFGHVLGLPPDDPRVRRLALRAYREYGRYLVDLMRLPSLSPDEIATFAGDLDDHEVEIRQILAGARDGGLILTVGHIGSNEAIAAHIARRGLSISVVADDSSFPELFELLRVQRAKWGVTLIPWRNLRAIYGVLRRREMLGLLIDWGYRSDGIPVRLFDAWTTVPAGPATLAAKTGSRILPISIHRDRDGVFQVSLQSPIDVPSTDPAELQRASQAMADALADAIRGAPEQWYSFKPLWPAGAAEAADLERRARIMQAGQPDPGPGRGLPPDEADEAAAERGAAAAATGPAEAAAEPAEAAP